MNIGIYVHIPFCASKCYYCDFTSYANREHEYEGYVNALIREMKAYAQIAQEPIVATTIFIGGGTPSVLPPFLLEKILVAIKEYFIVNEETEYSIETNPGTLTLQSLQVMKKYGINRISMGVQAYQNRLLERIGRIHTIDEFIENYYLCRATGFDNINVDLMFALPTQTLQDWKETLGQIVLLEPEHISTYSLIIEEGTRFGELFSSGQLQQVDEELDRSMYHYAKKYLEQKGYMQYEISNFAKKGKESKHNILYWRMKSYIGIGLGAHSYYNGNRYHNTYTMKDYIENSHTLGHIQQDIEHIDQKTAMTEYMFLGLRLNEGVCEVEFNKKFGVSMMERYKTQIEEHINNGLLTKQNERIWLTELGRDVSNVVFSSFLID